MRSFLYLLLSLLFFTQVSADVWNTNATKPPLGDWIVNVDVTCHESPCETRLLHLSDWDVKCAWCQYGGGSHVFRYNFIDELYFFRTRNGQALVTYTAPPPKCPVEYPWLSTLLLLSITILTHGWWIRFFTSTPCPVGTQ